MLLAPCVLNKVVIITNNFCLLSAKEDATEKGVKMDMTALQLHSGFYFDLKIRTGSPVRMSIQISRKSQA